MKRSIITMMAVLAIVATACRKDRTPGTTTLGVGVNYKSAGTVDTAVYIIDSFANLSFAKINFNLDSISKVLYASSATPSEAKFNSVTINFPDEYWEDYFENNVSLYVSSTGGTEKLYGTAVVPEPETHTSHDLVFKPVTGVSLSDYIGKSDLKFRAKAELTDSLDISAPMPLKLGSDVTLVFPK